MLEVYTEDSWWQVNVRREDPEKVGSASHSQTTPAAPRLHPGCWRGGEVWATTRLAILCLSLYLPLSLTLPLPLPLPLPLTLTLPLPLSRGFLTEANSSRECNLESRTVALPNCRVCC
jgi:hypothetical protein